LGSEAECFRLVQTEKEAEFTVRGRVDIIADILDQAKQGTKKTRIMYMCNLSFRQLGVYLDFLLKKKFLAVITSFEENSRFYRTTKKGLAFIEAYKNLQAVISS
jgi:predicted transcriptional regulator